MKKLLLPALLFLGVIMTSCNVMNDKVNAEGMDKFSDKVKELIPNEKKAQFVIDETQSSLVFIAMGKAFAATTDAVKSTDIEKALPTFQQQFEKYSHNYDSIHAEYEQRMKDNQLLREYVLKANVDAWRSTGSYSWDKKSHLSFEIALKNSSLDKEIDYVVAEYGMKDKFGKPMNSDKVKIGYEVARDFKDDEMLNLSLEPNVYGTIGGAIQEKKKSFIEDSANWYFKIVHVSFGDGTDISIQDTEWKYM